jgi:AP-3 complex subunit delta-1
MIGRGPCLCLCQDKLEDPEPSVQSAAVSVICELARKNPKNYLSLAPTFFKILNSSQNNWMRIKIIKLFAALCPLVGAHPSRLAHSCDTRARPRSLAHFTAGSCSSFPHRLGAVQEPRLAKKLIEPLTSLIHSTPAMSLLYECIQTVLSGIPDHTPTIQVAPTPCIPSGTGLALTRGWSMAGHARSCAYKRFGFSLRTTIRISSTSAFRP